MSPKSQTKAKTKKRHATPATRASPRQAKRTKRLVAEETPISAAPKRKRAKGQVVDETPASADAVNQVTPEQPQNINVQNTAGMSESQFEKLTATLMQGIADGFKAINDSTNVSTGNLQDTQPLISHPNVADNVTKPASLDTQELNEIGRAHV